MRVLVTGATGMLGSAVLPEFVGVGMQVRATSRRVRSGGGGGGSGSGGVEWVVADLVTGAGVGEAVAGVDAIVHLASAPYRGRYTDKVEVAGTERLLKAAREAGVRHVVYTSIIGCDRIPWGYFETKVRGEQAVRGGWLPWSVVRIAQFHEFVDRALRLSARTGVVVAFNGVDAQPVDTRDVAAHLAGRVLEGPGERVTSFAGPEVLRFEQAVRQWLEVRRKRRPVLGVRVPGKLGVAFRGGHLTADDGATGGITWRQYLTEKYA